MSSQMPRKVAGTEREVIRVGQNQVRAGRGESDQIRLLYHLISKDSQELRAVLLIRRPKAQIVNNDTNHSAFLRVPGSAQSGQQQCDRDKYGWSAHNIPSVGTF